MEYLEKSLKDINYTLDSTRGEIELMKGVLKDFEDLGNFFKNKFESFINSTQQKINKNVLTKQKINREMKKNVKGL